MQQTRVISQRRAQKMLSGRSTSKTKGDAAYEAMEAVAQAREQQKEARRVCEQKCQDAAEAETIFNGAINDTLEKNKALEKHVRTVTMRAESLATREADFFKTVLDRQEEAQRHFNELSAQRSHQNNNIPSHAVKSRRAERREKRQARTRCPSVCCSPLTHHRRHHDAGSQHNACGMSKNGVHRVRLSNLFSSSMSSESESEE